MAQVDQAQLKELLAKLITEHRDLDAAIASLEQGGTVDQLRLTRLKRQKLQLKDRIAQVEAELVPDIIA